MDSLHSQELHIPNLWPAFEGWSKGVNPYYDREERHDGDEDVSGSSRLRRAIDGRLEGLIADERKLRKAKAVDIGLFASCLFPGVTYDILETAAFYCIWLFFWDDAIDGNTTDIDTVEAGKRYRDDSVAFVRWCLLDDKDDSGSQSENRPFAPTVICGSFSDVATRARQTSGGEYTRDKIDRLCQSLEKYMDACVVEQEWRLSRSDNTPGIDEFWGWRLGTSSVDALLDLSMILNKIAIDQDVLESKELRAMRLDINKLLVSINELFSLKKELKDGAANMNLIPITMAASNDPSNLASATSTVVDNIYAYARDFDHNASILWARVTNMESTQLLDQFNRLVSAYQAVATCVLTFSTQSPRYGVLKDRQEDGGFLVTL